MKKYLITSVLLLSSVSPLPHSAQNSEKDTVIQEKKEEIEIMVDSLTVKKEVIIDKLETIKKLEQEQIRLERQKRKKEQREERELLIDIERVNREMNIH